MLVLIRVRTELLLGFMLFFSTADRTSLRYVVSSAEGKSRRAFRSQREVLAFSEISRFKIPGGFAVCVLVVCPSVLLQQLDVHMEEMNP